MASIPVLSLFPLSRGSSVPSCWLRAYLKTDRLHFHSPCACGRIYSPNRLWYKAPSSTGLPRIFEFKINNPLGWRCYKCCGTAHRTLHTFGRTSVDSNAGGAQLDPLWSFLFVQRLARHPYTIIRRDATLGTYLLTTRYIKGEQTNRFLAIDTQGRGIKRDPLDLSDIRRMHGLVGLFIKLEDMLQIQKTIVDRVDPRSMPSPNTERNSSNEYIKRIQEVSDNLDYQQNMLAVLKQQFEDQIPLVSTWYFFNAKIIDGSVNTDSQHGPSSAKLVFNLH